MSLQFLALVVRNCAGTVHRLRKRHMIFLMFFTLLFPGFHLLVSGMEFLSCCVHRLKDEDPGETSSEQDAVDNKTKAAPEKEEEIRCQMQPAVEMLLLELWP